MSAEQAARQNIDKLLSLAGWHVCDVADANIHAARGVAIREFPLKTGHGFADYLLYIDARAAGVIEAKKEGVTLTGVETQSDRYAQGLPEALPAWRRPLPFSYQSTGVETRFTNGLDPEPRSRPTFAFHRPDSLRKWLDLLPTPTSIVIGTGAPASVAAFSSRRFATTATSWATRGLRPPSMHQPDLFSSLQPTSENLDTEFKSARGGLPGSFWETYSAMANTQGGTVVLGVAERDGQLRWQGVPDAAQLRSVLWSQLNDRSKVSRNLLTDDDERTVEDDGRQFVVVHVPRASRRDRPVYVGPNPLTGTYRRAEEGDYRCTDEEVRRMLADQSDAPADAQVVEHFGSGDFDAETVKQYRNRFASRDPDHPWLSEDDAGLLLKLGAMRRDRATGVEGATVAGLLMFGTFIALRDALPSYHVDYRERLSSDPAVRWTDRVVPDGTWESNLFQFYQRVVQRLSADLKIPFQLDRELYRRDDTIVHEAIREAAVNALIHADHRGQGGVVIERYADRIELSNPGSLLVSREQLLRGSVSECRNKGLQLMFQMIGGGEKAGSGMDKIRAGWRSQHWRSPKIEESVQPDRVKLVLPMISLIPPEIEQELRERFGPRFAQLDKVGVQAVVTARLEGSVTNGRLQEITAEHPKDITGVFQALVRDGFLVQQSQRRWASYRLGDGVERAGDSRQTGADSPQSAGNSPQIERDSPQSVPNSPQISAPVLSEHLAGLIPIAEPARRSRRLPAPRMRGLILALCQGRWLSTNEIAALVTRDPDKLQTRFLTALVSEGLLEWRFPDVPNRPDQAYRKKET